MIDISVMDKVETNDTKNVEVITLSGELLKVNGILAFLAVLVSAKGDRQSSKVVQDGELLLV
jgi:hypothetical protein